jgi:hypothetical protein
MQPVKVKVKGEAVVHGQYSSSICLKNYLFDAGFLAFALVI